MFIVHEIAVGYLFDPGVTTVLVPSALSIHIQLQNTAAFAMCRVGGM